MGSYQPITTVAIVGGGPSGLAAAIALSKLPFISVTLYERNPEPQEIGAGISLSYNAWKILDLLGAGDNVRGFSKADTLQRNGYNGNIVLRQPYPESSDLDKRGAVRARRTRLQAELVAKVPEGVIQFNKKLTSLENLEQGGVRLLFEDQTEAVADLVVGAEGIRSVVRKTLNPDHQLRFTGTVLWRTLIPKSLLAHIPDVTQNTSWWWSGIGHAYFSGVDDATEGRPGEDHVELSVRFNKEPEISEKAVSWGIPATNERVQARFVEYDQRVKDAVAAVPEGYWREFAQFAGPGLEHIVDWDKVVLIGDASHPLNGAFGSGATFGMEDGWILARTLELEHSRDNGDYIKRALQIFEEIRLPYYKRMHRFLDERIGKLQKVEAGQIDFEDKLRAKFDAFGIGAQGGSLDWIYKHDIGQVWQDYLKGIKEDHSG